MQRRNGSSTDVGEKLAQLMEMQRVKREAMAQRAGRAHASGHGGKGDEPGPGTASSSSRRRESA